MRPYIVKRTQIYLDEEQSRRLSERAAATARTRSDLIRDALDRYLDGDTTEARLRSYREALAATAGAIPRLPPGEEYVEAIRAGDQSRDDALERRWRRG